MAQIDITKTGMTANSDLEEAFNAIRNKRTDLDLLFSYYNGPQPLKYSTERLADTFQNINAHFEINWTSVVIDATLDRLQLTGFTTPDKSTTESLKIVFDKLHLDIEADKAHAASLATSQAYMIVWKDGDEVVAYYNDPRMCHVFYEDSNPNKKRFAAKWFNRVDGKQEITLYYNERIEHWTSQKQQTYSSLDKASAFTMESSEGNTFGVIPVFELHSPGEIFKVLTLQDAENKLFSDMMIAAEFGAFIQRYVISNSDPGSLKNKPNEIWWIPSGDGAGQASSVGQFEPTQLNNYLEAMDKIASNIAIITRTPKHYFMTTGADLSGEALLAMEAPLVKKCQKRQNEFQSQWQDIAAFIAQLSGINITPDDVKCVWKRIESVQPLTEAQTMQTSVNTGIPLEVYLKRAGWTEEEIADVKKAKDAANKTRMDNVMNRVNSVRVPVAGVNDASQ